MEQEHNEMERLMAHAGIKTKREFVSNALTLFKWAANEIASGRRVASMDAQGGAVARFEMPSLRAFSRIADEFTRLRPSEEELKQQAAQSGIPAGQIIEEMKRQLEELTHAEAQRRNSGSHSVVG